ncbi:MAG: SEC-C domain-containing protein [Nocardioidaceae bacterium]|nr:SEC-C domain-containing protein [Nocardioidaceae bacterium]NUS49963.1 SEC-C domain-containing protein [Nocardioidaceae bacterium]
MGKKSRVKARAHTPEAAGEVGPRQPCPCGSGRRYKACHGSAAGPVPTYVARPFEGLPGECDLIAMREIVPAATAPLVLADGVGDGREVQVCSLLPMAAPALVRTDGSVWLGLQVQHNFGDPSRDLGAVLLKALEAEHGAGVIGLTDAPGDGPRLQDLVAGGPDDGLDVTVHEGFDYWVADIDDPDGSVAASLEQANQAANPSLRLASVRAAYWTDVGNREHLRWVLPYDEEPLLDALARLHVAGKDVVAEGSRFVGMFRAHGRVVPVWDLPSGTGAEALEDPATTFQEELETALADTSPLTGDERAARNGLTNRQLTIR